MTQHLLLLLALLPLSAYSQKKEPAIIKVKKLYTENIDSIVAKLEREGYRISKKANDINYIRLKPIRYEYGNRFNKISIEIWIKEESAELTGYDTKRNPKKIDLVNDGSEKSDSAIQTIEAVAGNLGHVNIW